MKQSAKERGQALVLYVVMLGVLIGSLMLVVDYGMGVSVRSKLQSTVDAAAMAGVYRLPADTAGATAAALDYAARNGVAANNVTITFPTNPPTDIRVAAQGTSGSFFSRFFGTSQISEGAVAVARIGPAGAVANLVPIAIFPSQYIGNTDLTFETNQISCKQTPCNLFLDIVLGQPGVSQFRSWMASGYPNYVGVGTVVQQNGNLSKWVQDGANSRIAQAPSETWDNHAKDSPRLVFIPVIDAVSGSGQTNYDVVGFASFFIEQVTSGGQIVGRFLDITGNGGTARLAPNWGAVKVLEANASGSGSGGGPVRFRAAQLVQ